MGYCVTALVAAGGTQAGVQGPEEWSELALPPPLPHSEGAEERRPESVEMAKPCTPLGNQGSMFQKRHKNLREKLSGEKCKIRLAL